MRNPFGVFALAWRFERQLAYVRKFTGADSRRAREMIEELRTAAMDEALELAMAGLNLDEIQDTLLQRIRDSHTFSVDVSPRRGCAELEADAATRPRLNSDPGELRGSESSFMAWPIDEEEGPDA